MRLCLHEGSGYLSPDGEYGTNDEMDFALTRIYSARSIAVRIFACILALYAVSASNMAVAAQSDGNDGIDQLLNGQWDQFFSDDIWTLLLWGIAVALVILLAASRGGSHHDPMHPAPTRVHIDFGPGRISRDLKRRGDGVPPTEDPNQRRRRTKVTPRPWG